MAKDPAFLFYSSDFLTGTFFMTDEQVGKYVRLLCVQHQHSGSIAKASFLQTVGNDKILMEKFKEDENGFFNERLREEMLKRKQKSNKMAANAKQKHSKRKTEAEPIEDENEREDENENTNEFKEGGTGEEKFIVPQMCKVWYESFPTYTQDKQNDFDGMGKILSFISRQHSLKDIGETGTQVKILNTMQLIADQVNRETFWINKPIKSIANNIQEFYNKIKNPQINGTKPNSSKQNGATAEGVQAILKERIAARQKQ